MNFILLKNIKTIYTYTLLLLFCLGFSFCAHAQKTKIDTLIKKFDSHQKNFLQEKLYVQTDRSYYLTGEILWFKIYDVDATFHKPLHLSKVAYVEILNSENRALVQTKVALEEGFGNGSIFLPASINSGNYQVRAYTNWMKNFEPESFFRSTITIVSTFKKDETIAPKKEEHYDAQFFPEGGNLVGGLKSRVAFRVINSQGQGIKFAGEVRDQNRNVVAVFSPRKFGIGSFTFTPAANQIYTATITDFFGNSSTYKLPTVKDEGFVMTLQDSIENQITLSVHSNVKANDSDVPLIYLVANTRQMIAAAEARTLRNGKTVFQIDKKKLGDGVSQLTLFDENLQPVAERLYFKQPEKKLEIKTVTDQHKYGTRRKVNLEISSENNFHQQEQANLSIAITRNDSLTDIDHDNILSYLLFTSELKGRIESPSYYLESHDNEAIDNLMLTHGWRRFLWNDILNNKKQTSVYIPEINGHFINGRVFDESGKPKAGVDTYLSTPQKNIQLYKSRSDAQGNVQYETKYFYGVKRIIAQTETDENNNYRIQIEDPFLNKFGYYLLPAFHPQPQQERQLLQRSVALQVQDIYHDKELAKFSNPVLDSVSFYGNADETYLLEDYTRFPTMEDVLREYVPGVLVRKRKDKFYFMVHDNPNKSVFRDNPLVLLDGLPVFDLNKIMAFDPLKVKKLEVVARKYYIGQRYFSGVVSYTTYHGDLAGFEIDPQSLSLDFEGLQLHREFYSPKYESQKQRESRIPDQRSLLYWNPSISTDKNGKYHLEFYTSDLDGNFQVRIEGISKKGVAGFALTNFEVAKEN